MRQLCCLCNREYVLKLGDAICTPCRLQIEKERKSEKYKPYTMAESLKERCKKEKDE